MQGLVKFSSMDSLRLYLKDLMTQYEKEADRYGEKVGYLMRILEKEGRGKDLRKLREIEWRRVGMVVVNDKDPIRGTLEVMIEAMEDCKAKATRTAEALTSVNELEEIGVPETASILVYLRHGVPLRVVIDNQNNPDVDVLVYTTYTAPSRESGTLRPLSRSS
jgi:hypothetical protein